VHRAAAAFGPLAALIPVGLVATAVLRPTYALLSGISMLLTLAFATSYDNAEIARYYLGPTLIAWTWLAILGGAVVMTLSRTVGPDDEGVAGPGRDPRAGPDPIIALGLTAALLLPTAFALPNRLARVDRSADVEAREWVDRALTTMSPGALIVSWWSYSTPLWYAQPIDLGLGDVIDVIDANLPNRPVYVIRVDPAEIAALERRYVLDYIDGPDARALTRVVSRREVGE